jgi:hypothetical protein
MKPSTIFANLTAGVLMVSASPTYVISELASRQVGIAKQVCSGATGNALCCATDVLQLADLDCKQRKSFPNVPCPYKTES